MLREVRIHRTITVLLAVALLATLSVALTGGDRADAVEGPVDVVYVTTGRNFPDALAGGTLAAAVGAPMLTVEKDLPIPDATVAALQSLRPDRIIIFGGPAAVSDAVKGALGDHTRSGAVTRIEGDDRHGTASAIADALPEKVHDADRLDGLDSSAFLRDGDDIDATSLEGLRLAEVGAVFGTRDRNLARQTVAGGAETVRTLDYLAPTDGFVMITASVLLSNTSTTDDQSFSVYLMHDWDGTLTPTTIEDAIVGADRVDVGPKGASSEIETQSAVLTTAFPVSAGAHTLDLYVEGSDVEHNVASITAVFSPNGSASQVGSLNPA